MDNNSQTARPAPQRRVTFVGGSDGRWRVERMTAVAGPPLQRVAWLAVFPRHLAKRPTGGKWLLRGVTSNERYTERHEHNLLRARQASLGRPEATCAALIPITKADSWWELSQDERRTIFEERSKHIQTGLEYLPAVARKLYHCRDLGEPFDFLTWFEYAPAHAESFDELVTTLRHTAEWTYVTREIDIRLTRGIPRGRAAGA